jgi:hypothetical protein
MPYANDRQLVLPIGTHVRALTGYHSNIDVYLTRPVPVGRIVHYECHTDIDRGIGTHLFPEPIKGFRGFYYEVRDVVFP